jgi:hypothetical protein
MSDPWNDLESKLEAAMQAGVKSFSLSVGDGEEQLIINTGLDDDDFGVPNVICSVESIGDEVVRGTGIFPCRATVTVTSHPKDTTLDAHRARVATVRDYFLSTTIAADLSAAGSDFYAYDVMFKGMRRDGVAREGGNVMKNILELDVICCGSDIS